MSENLTTIKGIEQGRAKYAYECAKKGSEIDKKKEYKSYVKKIPMLIKTNGLGATFAFVKSKLNNDKNKSGYAYKIIYEQTKEWLQNDNKHLVDLSNSKDLVFEIIKLNSTEYRAVTNEVLAFFNWLKRFADGLIEGESDNG